MSSLSRDSVITFASSGIGFFLAIVSSIIIARLIGPEGKGAYALLILIPTMAFTLGNFGINQSITYHMARERQNSRQVFFMGLMIVVVIGALLYLALRFSLSWWYNYYQSVPLELFRIILPLVFILMLYNFLEYALLGTGRVDLYNLSNIVSLAIGVAGLGVAMLLPGERLENIVICSLLGFILAIVFAGSLVWKTGTLSRSEATRRVSAREFLGFGGINQVTTVSQFLSYRLDQFMLPAMIGPEALGIYTVSVALTERVWMFSAAMQTSLMPRIPSSSEAAGIDITVRSLKHIIIITTAAVLGLAALGFFVIRILFGKAFTPAYLPMLIMLPGTYFIAIWKILGTFFISTNRPRVNAVIAIISMPVNFFLNLVLIPRLGIIGAAVSSSVSYCITGLLIVFLFRRTTGLGLRQMLVPGRSEINDYRLLAARILARLREPGR